MKSKASLGKHPIHPMLVVIPIGLWIFSLVCDIFYLAGLDANWRLVSAYCIAGGCLGGMLAAIPGIIDYSFIDGPKARSVASWPLMLNAFLICLYGFNFFMRFQNEYELAGMPFALSVVGMVVLGISGWLGGELVYVHQMGVEVDEGPKGGHDESSETKNKQSQESKRAPEQVGAGKSHQA